MWIDRILVGFIALGGLYWIVTLHGYHRARIERLDPNRNMQLTTWIGIVVPTAALIIFLIRNL